MNELHSVSVCKDKNSIPNILLIGFMYHPRLTMEKVVWSKNIPMREDKSG